MRLLRRGLVPMAIAALAVVVGTGSARTAVTGIARQVDRIHRVATVNLAQLAAGPARSYPNVRHLSLTYAARRTGRAQAAADPLGGATTPAGRVTRGGQRRSFNGISAIDMETGGTGKYAGTNPTLEPPDQGLCSDGSDVIETVNDSLRVYTASGRPLMPKSVPLAQFFARQPNASVLTDFISDPRCIYDSTTKRWFVTILDLSEPVPAQFVDDRNFIAVSRTSDPAGNWSIYSFDVTDNGLNGTPAHSGCIGAPAGALAGCLGDQPTIGVDRNGVYVTDNEYAFAEVFPVSPPVVPPFQQIPVLRSGVAQLYALSKHELEHGSDAALVRFDSDSIPFPGPAEDSPWQSISPATAVPGDTSHLPSSGVEYFLSSVGLPVGHNAGRIVVWAWTNTASLNGAHPRLKLQHAIISTARRSDTFYAPDPASLPFAAYQKDGPHPAAAAAGDPEEELNANDDRMNWVSLSAGSLWTAVNTLLPPSHPGAAGHAGEDRVGIMYFRVTPSISRGTLHARTSSDGYLQVRDGNVLFGSIGPRADGATVMTFTLTGLHYFPSLAWARLDSVRRGSAPVIHIARPGAAPEDGFSGLGTLGQQGLPDVPPCNPCVARWGDYSASEVAPNGCVWGAAEYIPSTKHDKSGQVNWGTGIVEVCPPPAHKRAHGPRPRLIRGRRW